MKEQVENVINQIRPILQADGGDIQLISVDEKTGIVTVRGKVIPNSCSLKDFYEFTVIGILCKV